ncbi:response regulator [Sphingomonas sp. ASY06-1R]|uniref:response regulator n=1 Tax=Sphingomonas sp. ASY06-1R TaxID=3445771 RepID=UPI003FA28A99
MNRPTILIIDDHALFRSGVAAMLSTGLRNARICEAASLEEALTDNKIDPSILMLDVQLRGISGIDGMPSLKRKWPLARIVVVSAFDTDDVINDALAMGAETFLAKTERPDRMIATLRQMLDDPSGASPTPITTDTRSSLTPRQKEVLDLVCQGLSNKMIGRRLNLSEHTVRGHVQALLAALGVASRTEAAFAARRLGIIR